MLTYLDPPENIGITCQKEPFDIESLRDTLQGEHNTGPMQEERLERIPSVKKLVGPADVMPSEEAEYKVCQYCHLWTMYADSSVELKKEIRTFTGKCSSSLQNVRTIHLQHYTPNRKKW